MFCASRELIIQLQNQSSLDNKGNAHNITTAGMNYWYHHSMIWYLKIKNWDKEMAESLKRLTCKLENLCSNP